MDSYGRYTLAELREQVRRKLDMLRARTIEANGNENPSTWDFNPLVTNQDINAAINSAITMRTIDIATMSDETVLADEELLDVEPGKIEYELPTDMCLLRSVLWKEPTQQLTLVPPLVPPTYTRFPMVEVDEPDGPTRDGRGIPTYKRRLNYIVLNEHPTVFNQGGIAIDYVKWLNPLLDDDAIIETQFARIVQECVIYDAAIELTLVKLKVNADELVAARAGLNERLILAVRNAHMPTRSQLEITPTVIPLRRRS